MELIEFQSYFIELKFNAWNLLGIASDVNFYTFELSSMC